MVIRLHTSQVPNVKWEDVGGLEDVKKAILDTVQVLAISFCSIKTSCDRMRCL